MVRQDRLTVRNPQVLVKEMLCRRRFSQRLLPSAPSDCSFCENICTIPKPLNFPYNHRRTTDAAPPHREGVPKKNALAPIILIGMAFIWASDGSFHVLVV
jgi:hypothetical protein